MRMRHVFRSVLFYNVFPHYLTNGTILEKKIRRSIKYMFWYYIQILSETFLIVRWTERNMMKNAYWSLYWVPVILVRFKWLFILLDRYSKNTQIPNFMKICPVGPDLCRANRRTDERTEGRKDGRTEGRTDGRKDGRTDGRKEGRTERRTDGRTDGKTDGRKDGQIWRRW